MNMHKIFNKERGKIRSRRSDIKTVEIEGLTLNFNGVDYLNSVNFDFIRNSIYWLKGGETGHQSTFLKAIAGIKNPVAGKILINGKDIVDMTFEEFLPYRLNIGYSFDFGGLIYNRTIRENLMLPLMYHNEMSYDEAKLWVDEMLEFFHITQHQDLRPASVPGGIRKLTCVIRSLVMSPQFVILDNPTVGLSSTEAECLSQWLANEFKEKSIRFMLIASNDESWMKQFEHQVLLMFESHLSVIQGSYTAKAVGL